MGHVRDLPNNASEIPASRKGHKWASLGVNTEANFEPLYVIPKDKKKVVRELKDALKDAQEVLLATDEDREGESISWHLVQLLAPKVPVKRMVFHEITQEAIAKALDCTRELDMELVHAQETRRILDRLVGYTLSPLLWKKVAWGLSAGRVQSVAVRLVVQKERERRAFRSGSYWDLRAHLDHAGVAFDARLIRLSGQKIATGSDFDESTGKLKKGTKVKLLNQEAACTLAVSLQKVIWKVEAVEEKPSTLNPVAPFITSTLQQEANRKLRLSTRETMRCAQGLYERGFITYMRTDSSHLSIQAIQAARNCIEDLYGCNYLSHSPRQFTAKTRNAQEAHEAIRPSGEYFRPPKETTLSGKDLALYELIWKRTVASQMSEARLTILTIDLSAAEASFRANGKRINFPGFLRVYVEGSDDINAALESQEILLPVMNVGDLPIAKEIEPRCHQTQPPTRYSEASLVRMLEKEGIGRPSTYASIIGTIVDRGYAVLQSNALSPSFTAFAVTALLEDHFPDLVDTGFTARMESTLDEISTGRVPWLPYLESFYKGDAGLEYQVQQREGDIDPNTSRTIQLEGLPCAVRIGRFGAYLESKRIRDGGEEELIKATLPREITPADLDEGRAEMILKHKVDGPEPIGEDPETGDLIYLLFGQYGPYIQRGQVSDRNPKPKRASLPKGVKPEELKLDDALGLLNLPRLLGEHPDGGRVQAGLGRFGPYIVWDKGKGEKDYRSLKSNDNVLEVELSRALELLSTPKRVRGGRMALKNLGKPEGVKESIQIYTGPYGPYVKQGKINASLPEDKKVESITLEEAMELLAAKASTKKTTGRPANRNITRNAVAEKTSRVSKSSVRKTQTTTKTGRLRASAVRIIQPGDK